MCLHRIAKGNYWIHLLSQIRVKLARNEQCITLYPLTTRYSVGPFPSHVIFRPSQSPFILGLISSIRLLMACYYHFLLVGQIQPVVTVGPFVVR